MPWREMGFQVNVTQGPDATPPGSWMSTEESPAQSSLAALGVKHKGYSYSLRTPTGFGLPCSGRAGTKLCPA